MASCPSGVKVTVTSSSARIEFMKLPFCVQVALRRRRYPQKASEVVLVLTGSWQVLGRARRGSPSRPIPGEGGDTLPWDTCWPRVRRCWAAASWWGRDDILTPRFRGLRMLPVESLLKALQPCFGVDLDNVHPKVGRARRHVD